MNYKMFVYIIGSVLKAEAAVMTPPLLIAVFGREGPPARAFFFTILLLAAVGFAITVKKPANAALFARDGFAIVALCWIVVSFFGALPFYFSGAIPSFVDCFFETVSGYTTTGATILTDIEAIPPSLLFWRAFTHWIGGMGVLLFVMMVMSSSGGYFLNLMKAESPGPSIKKMVPRMSDNAKILYAIYFMMTLAEVILLLMGGMSLFDSLIHSFSTAGTGGFSSRNASVAAFHSPYIEWVITIFMLLFGVNFNIYYLIVVRKIAGVFKNDELKAYFGIAGAATLIMTVALYRTSTYTAVGDSLRYAAFQAASVMTTTGFVTADFNLWPPVCHVILSLLMIIGASAGSTGGGIKVSRLLIQFKAAAREVRKIVHPRSVEVVKLDGGIVEEETVLSVGGFLMLYFALSCFMIISLALFGYDMVTSITATLTCIGNVGPGLSLVGPVSNFGFMAPLAKVMLSFIMLFGRLEIFPMLILFSPVIYMKRRLRSGRQ